jgi:hypothetical protein
MSVLKGKIPPPPRASFEKPTPSTPGAGRRPQLSAPLDDGFLKRVYVSTLWVGALAAMLAYGATNSVAWMGSLIGGMALGALLLKSQEVFVRKVLSTGDAGSGKARAAIALLLGLKFVGVMAVMGLAMESGWLLPGALALGFFMQQLIVIAKVMGRFFHKRMRSQAVGTEI